jgi:hypothetical protein
MNIDMIFNALNGEDTPNNSNGMSVDEILDRAADIIDDRGWCQNHFQNDLGEVCVLGALNHAVYPVLTCFVPLDCGKLEPVGNFLRIPRLPSWNDHTCKNRYEATEFLRGEAKRYREENSK